MHTVKPFASKLLKAALVMGLLQACSGVNPDGSNASYNDEILIPEPATGDASGIKQAETENNSGDSGVSIATDTSGAPDSNSESQVGPETRTQADAGVIDSSMIDSSMIDSSVPDSSMIDSTVPDSSMTDSSMTDSSPATLESATAAIPQYNTDQATLTAPSSDLVTDPEVTNLNSPLPPSLPADAITASPESTVAAASTDSGQSTSTDESVEPAPPAIIQAYDKLMVKIKNVDELSGAVQVNAKGEALMPLIGIVKASGFTPGQLAARLQEQYGRDFLQDPQIAITIIQ